MNQSENMPIQVSALLVTRNNNGKIIEILNVLAHNKDTYGFPGGKLEANESPEEAVIRETEEELGVTPNNVEYLEKHEGVTPEGRSIVMHVFTGNVSENITPTNEIAELHWLSYEQMVASRDLLTPMTIKHVLPLIKALYT